MNTSKSENDKDHLVRPDYYTQLWFENGQLTAAVLQDDYTSWFDLTAGISGSNLADLNDRTSRESLETLLDEWYLTKEVAALYYDVIETNDIEAAARAYPFYIGRGFKYIPIQEKHATTLEKIRERAQLLYIRETGDTSA